MPAFATSRQKSGPSSDLGLEASTMLARPATPVPSPEAAAPAAAVRETLAAVTSAADALERGLHAGQNSVDLQLKVGGEKLAVRVELRDGIVHTTFRTDSGELRSALAQGWQSVVPSSATRENRLAEPVFQSATTGGNGTGGSPGQGGAHRQSSPTPDFAALAFGKPLAGATVTAPAPAVSAALNSTQLLSAFA